MVLEKSWNFFPEKEWEPCVGESGESVYTCDC